MKTVRYLNGDVMPSKIICVGRNYVAHAKELGNAVPTEPVVFIKPNSAISHTLSSGGSSPSEDVNHYEGELCFIVNKGQLSGVGFGLDLTKRQIQQRLKEAGLPWERAKSFDGAAVLSDFVSVTNSDIYRLSMTLEIDGHIVQQGNVEQMLFKPEQILSEIKTFLSLEDGDVIMTGTPKGVGPVVEGSEYTGTVSLDDNILVQANWTVNN